MVFGEIDEYLTSPLKVMSLVTLFNRIDVKQTRDYIKISGKTYMDRVCEKHMTTWVQPSKERRQPSKSALQQRRRPGRRRTAKGSTWMLDSYDHCQWTLDV